MGGGVYKPPLIHKDKKPVNHVLQTFIERIHQILEKFTQNTLYSRQFYYLCVTPRKVGLQLDTIPSHNHTNIARKIPLSRISHSSTIVVDMYNFVTNSRKNLEICKQFAGSQVNKKGNVPRRGVVPMFSDLEVVTHSITAEAFSIDSENYLCNRLNRDCPDAIMQYFNLLNHMPIGQ